MNADPATEIRRVFARRRILTISSLTFHTGTRLLAEAAHQRIGEISAVVGIANGGRAPAATIAHALNAPTYQVTARHNPTNDLYTEATGRVDYDLRTLTSRLAGNQLPGSILLVDDICGTGATFTTVLLALAERLTAVSTVHTVALCRNIGAAYQPHLWLWDVDDWVHFPWENPLPSRQPTEELNPPPSVQPARAETERSE